MMILLIECDIDADTILAETIELFLFPYTIKMHPDERQRLAWMSVKRHVADYKDHIPKIEHKNGQLTGIVLPNGAITKDQRELLQYLESLAALDLGIRKIHHESMRIRWIPETEEERSALPITGYYAREESRINNRALTKGWLQGAMLHRNMMQHLKEPLMFYRLGANFYEQKLYILSFIHFFLMLEGLFSEGNTDKKFMIASFMKADHLDYGIVQTFQAMSKPGYGKHKTWFDNYHFQNAQVNDDPKIKLLNLFYDSRGLLSHYTIKSSRKRFDFDQGQYHSLAFIAMSVCHFCSIKVRLAPFRKMT